MNGNSERYRCQMSLPGFGRAAQDLLQKARVLIVGAGGLGCPAAQYLAAAGIGTICIADDDTVSVSNLHRQILYGPADVGLPKAEIAAKRLQQQNPGINIIPCKLRVTAGNVMALVEAYDLVIEGTDNFETKYLLNDACVLSGKPLVYGAIYQFEGQMSIWNVLQNDGTYSAHYRDVFPDAGAGYVPNCAEGGVSPALAGIVGCMQANEAIKYFTRAEDSLSGKLWMIDVRNGETRIVKLKKNSSVNITELPETVPVLTCDALWESMDGQYRLIDVRTAGEHNTFNIGGENIPLDELEEHMKTASFSKPVVCYCTSGSRSATAVRLIRKSFPNAEAYSLQNGIGQLKIESRSGI